MSLANGRARGEEGKSLHSAGVITDGHEDPRATVAGGDGVGPHRASLGCEPACPGAWTARRDHGWGQKNVGME